MVKLIKISDGLHDFLINIKNKHNYNSIEEYLDEFFLENHSTYPRFIRGRKRRLSALEKS